MMNLLLFKKKIIFYQGLLRNKEFIIELDKIIRSEMKNLKEFRLDLEQGLGQNGQDLLDKIHKRFPF